MNNSTCIIIIDYKNSVLPVVWASQDGANVITIIVNAKVDLYLIVIFSNLVYYLFSEAKRYIDVRASYNLTIAMHGSTVCQIQIK